MKKIFAIILAVLMLLPCLAACAEEEPILPPVREGKSRIQPSSLFFSIEDIEEKAEAMVRLKVKNWLGESEKRTFYEAEVVEVYKGEVPESIILTQLGSSKATYQDFPLFTYGNEFIVFIGKFSKDNIGEVELNIDPSEFDFDNVYYVHYRQRYIMNVATLDNGREYIIPAAPYMMEQNKAFLDKLTNYGATSEKGISSEAKSAAGIIKAADSYNDPGSAPEYVFILDDYLKAVSE